MILWVSRFKCSAQLVTELTLCNDLELLLCTIRVRVRAPDRHSKAQSVLAAVMLYLLFCILNTNAYSALSRNMEV